MLHFQLSIYNYSDKKSLTYFIGGYNYKGGGGDWVNCTAYGIGHPDSTTYRNLTVRFSKDSNEKPCIYIGEANTKWPITTFQIHNVVLSHTNDEYTNWIDAFTMSLESSFSSSTHQQTITNTSVANGGNASTATKLVTARTINGTNFDGTANITTANWGTARNIQIGNTTRSVNGSGNYTWSHADIGTYKSFIGHQMGGSQTNIITDTGCGNIHLAGALIEVVGRNKGECTIRIHTATTSSNGGMTNGDQSTVQEIILGHTLI